MASSQLALLTHNSHEPDQRGKLRYSTDGTGSYVERRVFYDGQDRHSRVVITQQNASRDAACFFDSQWLRQASWPILENACGSIRAVDLFSGCGAMSLGAWEACRALSLQFEPVLAADLDEDALAIYSENFRPQVALGAPIESCLDGKLGSPITSQEKSLIAACGHVDLLIGGPPCQGHSDLNNHTRRNDPKNSLILRMVRFAEIAEPPFIVIENVQGILHDKNKAAYTAIDGLTKLGYSVEWGLLDASDVGVAQHRRRCFVIASVGSAPSIESIRYTHATDGRDFDWACADLSSVESESLFDTPARVSEENQRRMEYLIQNALFELPDSERPDCHRLKPHGYTSVYGRMRPDRPAPTITTGFGSPGQGRFTHPKVARTLTPHEAA